MASGKNGKTEHRNVTHTTFSKMVRRVIQIPVEPRWAKLDKQSIAPCFFRKHSNAGDCKQGGARLRLVTLRDFFLWCHDSWDINRTFYILLFKPYWLKHIVKDIYMLHVHWCKEGLGSGMSSSFIISRWSLLAPPHTFTPEYPDTSEYPEYPEWHVSITTHPLMISFVMNCSFSEIWPNSKILSISQSFGRMFVPKCFAGKRLGLVWNLAAARERGRAVKYSWSIRGNCAK